MSKLITVENPRGTKLTFSESDHKYSDENNNVYRSVTKIIHCLFPEFERDKIAMFSAKKRGCTVQEILQEWKDIADTACTKGTLVHRYAECMLQSIPFDMRATTQEQADCIKLVHAFIPKLMERYEFVEAEKIIFSEEFKLAGTVDLIMRNKNTGNYAIFDWKTNKEIKLRDEYGKYGKMFLSKIPHCNYYHYALQLNVYRYILVAEGYGDFNDCELALFHIHPNHKKGIKPYLIPDMTEHAKLILDYVKETHGDIW